MSLSSMSKDEVIAWIGEISTDNDFTSTMKQTILDALKDENNEEIGQDLFESEDCSDIKELCPGVGRKAAAAFLIKISDKKQEGFDKQGGATMATSGASTNSNKEEEKFTVNVIAQKGGIVQIDNVTKQWKVSQLKAQYLSDQGNGVAADNYRYNHKWDSDKGKIDIIKSSKVMQNDRTLESYGITRTLDTAMPLTVLFKVIGGAEAKYDDDVDAADKYRARKLRRKKHKGVIKFTSKPDCIMGYTDKDGIKRAEMPCGCAMASDTMYRYMKALFEKDFKSYKIYCPNHKKEEWDWSLVFVIADLSEKEIIKYSRIITQRGNGCKNCPHCHASTQRPKDLRICRVRCTQCNNSDWCWNCEKVWRSGGLGPICGNSNCMGAQINNILNVPQSEWISIGSIQDKCGHWKDVSNSRDSKIPPLRACPECHTIIKYTDACKHMYCLCCPYEFCFNCLGNWKNGTCSHSNICSFKSIQQFR